MNKNQSSVSILGIIVTLGIVYGDIGTSPLYVMRAIVGNNPITETVVYGGISCVFWTLTLQATIKYIWLALTADNHGEGGIFALFSLVRRVSPKALIYVAMIGCSALLADGIITPAISLSSAVEGLNKIYPNMHHEVVIIIVLAILLLLFTFQQFGTDVVGKAFGPLMVIWFLTLAILGIPHIISLPSIVAAFNPIYAINMIANYPEALALIGAVFLCVTGAEAMYSDLGHCGKENIRASWIFVKTCLLLNYLGQGAWLMKFAAQHPENPLLGNLVPFYEIMPKWFIIPGIILATIACVIASQALISGSFSMINEAVKLKVWYRTKINYPSEHRSQLYIPAINWMLFFGCVGIVLYFQESAKMEHAYGLAITIAMLSTTILLLIYWHRLKHKSLALVATVGIVFILIESGFMYANMSKLFHGAWVSLLITFFFFVIMFVHYRASRIKSKAIKYVKVDKYKDLIHAMSDDETIPEYAQHLVYMINANRSDEVEYSVIYSMIFKEAKRAKVYWFLNIHVSDEPYAKEYRVHSLIKDKLYRVDFYLGYRVHPAINLMFNQVLEDMEKNEEIKIESPHPSLQQFDVRPGFKYIVTEKVFAFADTLTSIDKITVRIYEFLGHFSINAATNYDLNSENLVIEEFPIRVHEQKVAQLKRKV